MGRNRFQPWPLEVQEHYCTIYNCLLRIEAMLETCLAENEMDNPYLFETLLPKAMKRFGQIIKLFQEMVLYAPEGSGALPMWLKVSQKSIRICQVIYTSLDSSDLKLKIRSQRFPEVEMMVKEILSSVRYMQKQLVRVPLNNGVIMMTKTGFVEIMVRK